jgi:hypothetical protein
MHAYIHTYIQLLVPSMKPLLRAGTVFVAKVKKERSRKNYLVVV